MTDHVDGYCSRCGNAIAVNPQINRGYCPYCKDDKKPLKQEDLSEFMGNLYGFYWTKEKGEKD